MERSRERFESVPVRSPGGKGFSIVLNHWRGQIAGECESIPGSSLAHFRHVATSSCGGNGFAKKSSMPDSSVRSRSSSKAPAVSAMMEPDRTGQAVGGFAEQPCSLHHRHSAVHNQGKMPGPCPSAPPAHFRPLKPEKPARSKVTRASSRLAELSSAQSKLSPALRNLSAVTRSPQTLTNSLERLNLRH